MIHYQPGPANAAHIEKDGERWTLVVIKQLRHPPERVWQGLTDPEHLRQWAPFDADKNMGVEGATVGMTTIGAPSAYVWETTVTRAEAPKYLEYAWGDNPMRWELEPVDGGTRLTLWMNIDRRYMAMGAAGWQICFDVLESELDGNPIGRMAGMEAMKFEGWQRLNREYSLQFGVEAPTGGA